MFGDETIVQMDPCLVLPIMIREGEVARVRETLDMRPIGIEWMLCMRKLMSRHKNIVNQKEKHKNGKVLLCYLGTVNALLYIGHNAFLLI